MPRTTDGDGPPVPQRLLAAATRLFAEQGYDRTSVQEIVEAAGVTKGALYHYFGSKDDLLHEVYARVLRVQQERLDAYANADEAIPERPAGARRPTSSSRRMPREPRRSWRPGSRAAQRHAYITSRPEVGQAGRRGWTSPSRGPPIERVPSRCSQDVARR
ncbi:hypothetical protein SHIRM173S_11601 [Streptomyces hirsutus]